MKQSLLKILACPKCRRSLTLTGFLERAFAVPEVWEGVLKCEPCAQTYPVIEGIPRFVPNALAFHPEFLKKYPQAATAAERERFQKLHGDTQERFSYEWMRYPGALEEDRPIFLYETQIPEGDWAGRKVLDGGCGMGRYSRVAHSLGAEVVAMDIGTALVRLQDVAQSSARMHIVQGDLTCPPFIDGAFDTVYSVGVIHHTPSAKETFKELARVVRPQGYLTVWVYGAPGPYKNFKTNPLRDDRKGLDQVRFLVWTVNVVREIISDTLRVFTVHMPHQLLYIFCYALAAIGKIPLVKYLTFSVHDLWRVRLQENFDWLTPPYQSHHTKEELTGWFEAAGFEALKVLPHGFVPKPGVLGRKK